MRKLLLIKTSSLGDVVHNLPVVSDVAERFPDAAIDWVVESSFADIPRLHPGVRRVIPVDLRRWRKALWRATTWRAFAEFKHQLRVDDYDAVIDTQGLFKSALLANWAHGPSCGQDHASAREPFATYLYDRRFHVERGRHAVLRNRDLVAQALGYTPPLTAPVYGICAPREAMPETLRTPYFVCLHGTSRASKCWPVANWISLADTMRQHGVAPVFPWGNVEEHQRANAIAAVVPEAIVLPRLPLHRLSVVLEHARAVVGVDTGLAHLAVALARPTVAIYTDTSPTLTGVYPPQGVHAVNLGDRGRIPMPADVLKALSDFGVW